MNRPLYTIGHSTHDADAFVKLLRDSGISAIADVRSSPYSKFTPQFNREPLSSVLRNHGIHYVFLGRELGARREERECYVGNQARYDLIAKSPLFREGLDRVASGAATHSAPKVGDRIAPIRSDCPYLVNRGERRSASYGTVALAGTERIDGSSSWVTGNASPIRGLLPRRCKRTTPDARLGQVRLRSATPRTTPQPAPSARASADRSLLPSRPVSSEHAAPPLSQRPSRPPDAARSNPLSDFA